MSTTASITLRRPDDMHVHLREGELLEFVLPFTARTFGRAIVMPNLKKPIVTGDDAWKYQGDIRRLCDKMGLKFAPLMTIKLTQATTPSTIRGAHAAGVVAVKLYPEGVTTNSEDGVSDVNALGEVFAAMAEIGLTLCVHAEEPGTFSLEREMAYLPRVARIAAEHPDLCIVVEHVSSEEAVLFVREAGPNVAATITAHHLVLTLDDVIGDKLAPHCFCKPIAKRPRDRRALRAAATSGDPKFFLGTDSAPHRTGDKECGTGCAGCFTAPMALPLLASIFEKDGRLEMLERFTSESGALFYGLPPSKETITLHRESWTVPSHGPVVTFMAGSTLAWRPELEKT